ncbi:MAG: UDP-N-acetylmuramate dehydrogenase [Gammaproteobacteria bacterium]|nr:UDP-N-acetylmuramate dehydrogenase [Gammaproteobacteria bacterium]
MMARTAGQMTPWRGRLRTGQALARYTTWRVGGPAERLYEPVDRADLAAFLGTLPADEPIFFLGRGSNLLVRDGGLRGTVVLLAGALTGIDRIDAVTVTAEAGVPSARLARFAARAGLAGIEFLAGIPGTVGGALAMNAGAHGAAIWDSVGDVEVIDRRGALRTRTVAEYTIGYRTVRGPAEEWFVAATLRLQPADPELCQRRIQELLTHRAATQPLGKPNSGSVFRNPPGDHAGRLIEAAGLKGAREGGCQVSTLHANFIINDGGATARDIEQLIWRVRDAVRLHAGVELQLEVRIVGEPGPEPAGRERNHDL